MGREREGEDKEKRERVKELNKEERGKKMERDKEGGRERNLEEQK